MNRRKTLVIVVTIAVCLWSGPVRSEPDTSRGVRITERTVTPVSLGIFGPVKLPWWRHDVVGLSLGVFNCLDSMDGLQIGFNNAGTQWQTRYGWTHYSSPSASWSSYGPVTTSAPMEGKMRGVQIGFLNNNEGDVVGFQLALGNMAEGNVNGMQLGLVNGAKQLSGLQIGIVNGVEHLAGVQVGVLNLVKSSPEYLMLPLVRWSF